MFFSVTEPVNLFAEIIFFSELASCRGKTEEESPPTGPGWGVASLYSFSFLVGFSDFCF